jgi:hypothetical protein
MYTPHRPLKRHTIKNVTGYDLGRDTNIWPQFIWLPGQASKLHTFFFEQLNQSSANVTGPAGQ